MSTDGESDLLKQYHRIKEEHPDSILFFRLGDFYELFYEDAEVGAREMEVQLTSKPVAKEKEIPMAGVPVRSVDSYLEALLEAGHRVAICEQTEDASEADGIVNREVVRVVTPGTLTEEEYLVQRENNYLMSVVVEDGDEPRVGVAFVDLSTGEFEATQFRDDDDYNLLDSELNRLHPSEVLVPDDRRHLTLVDDITPYRDDLALARRPGWQSDPEEGERILTQEFEEQHVEEVLEQPLARGASGALLHYLKETQKQTLQHVDRIRTYERQQFMILDSTSQRNLELVRSLTGQDKATLFGVLDHTQTAMGGRRLRRWIQQPLMDRTRIGERQGAVEWLTDRTERIDDLNEELRHLYDVQRIVGKIGSNRANPRDLKALLTSLERIPAIQSMLPDEGLFGRMADRLEDPGDLRDRLDRALVDNPPALISEGGIFRSEYDEELKELRDAMSGGKDWIAELQKQERERLGVESLKVGHNKVHGYYIEVTKANTDAVPDDYERKQTLKNSERYITDELKQKESQILGAEEKSHALEEKLFKQLREFVSEYLDVLKQNADVLADLDVLACFAHLALERNYSRPSLHDDRRLTVEQGRHPVVEQLHEEEFVPNDIELDRDRRQVVLTGPNMSGKSTYIRQVALITIMAQMGSYVPAQSAEIGLVDQVFTRVGAHDFLAGGQSTFMVEMVETADILNHATDRSLLILDEVGRGTSTYDGLAIARAVMEYIVGTIEARTLFATHYHELTDMAEDHPTVMNLVVRAREWEDEIVFLRQVEEGRSDRSYGVQVARLAGLPEPVLGRARSILNELQTRRSTSANGSSGEGAPDTEQIDLFHPARPVLERILNLETERLTPLEALQLLDDIQSSLDELVDESEPSE